MSDSAFSGLSDDVVLIILFKLQDDPRNWARLACVSTKFSALIRNVCCKARCSQTIPSVVSDLLFASPSAADSPAGGWAALHKLVICCPGLAHAGVLLENSDFGLDRELGPDQSHHDTRLFQLGQCQATASSSGIDGTPVAVASGSECSWSLFDDLYFDTVHNASESQGLEMSEDSNRGLIKTGCEFSVPKRRKTRGSFGSHLASGVRSLSREQGNKLLASRFRGDCLYICDWPGCVHSEEKRNYMLFRGIFKNFKQSRVWRTINDGNRNKIDLNCAFCPCNQTWDLHSAFCLRRVFGYHDDGEPVVRAFVCENGHVSGAWTDWPLYT
ncbi:phytochrome A-associated F-box protein [Diospyros lotus]|uniref:phytochrome A-associated F-box protein n=1 Tax=Diospyros lotus TaxID=55363 RepID=UPI002254E7F1|nr:phytochrome A-associated F-box protein [Diospyros lotus]